MYINAKEHHNCIQTSASFATRDKLGVKTAISGTYSYRARPCTTSDRGSARADRYRPQPPTGTRCTPICVQAPRSYTFIDIHP